MKLVLVFVCMLFLASCGTSQVKNEGRASRDGTKESIRVDTPKAKAVSKMINLIYSSGRPVFAVMINKYYIEGVAYKTFMFTVSEEHTPDISQTNSGFLTTGIFRESMVHSAAKINKKVQNGLVKVELEIKYQDIWSITGKDINGNQINLYSQ